MLDLDTFIIMIYVFVDDWYKQDQLVAMKPTKGRPAQFTDSEALTLAIISEWRAGVSWQSERGFMRYMHKHYREWFPYLPQRSAFNERKRHLFGRLARLQEALVQKLTTADELYECVDCLPIPAGSLGQYSRATSHWLWTSTIGRGKARWFWGDHLLAAIRPCGMISGWLLGAAHIHDRWLMEGFVSARQGKPQLIGPPHRKRDGRKARHYPPVGFLGGWQGVGTATDRFYLADKSFNGHRWRKHWQQHFHAKVISVPPDNTRHEKPWTRQAKTWLASHRQIVETAFAVLVMAFNIKHLRAHSRWGQYTRICAKIVGYNLGIWLNLSLGRPRLSHETLVC